MIKKILFILVTCINIIFFISSGFPAGTNPVIGIGGFVESPIRLSISELSVFKQTEITVYENSANKKTKIRYRGIPLATLLEISKVQKVEEFEGSLKRKHASYNIAVSIKNTDGKQLVLSLGEIIFQNRNSIVVALEKGKSKVTKESKQNNELPELIFTSGNTVVHSLKNINSIDIIRIPRLVSEDKFPDDKSVYVFNGDENKKMLLSEAISKCKTTSMSLKGNKKSPQKDEVVSYKGVLVKDLIKELQAGLGFTSVISIISRDGYLTGVSYREILGDTGKRMMIVPQGSDKDKKEATYDLVSPDDAKKGRWVRDIRAIEISDLKQKPMIYVIGVGCGDTTLLTNEAISGMNRADVFICMEKYENTLGSYIAGKPVLFDPFMQLAKFYMKKHPEVSPEQAEKKAKELYNKDMKDIRDALDKGKIVALLEPGDPTLFGGWRNWLSPNFPKEAIKVITGVSSFNAANAMLGEINLTNSSVIITEPESLKANESLIQSAAKTGDVIVVFMGIDRMKSLAPQFNKYYSKDTPVYFVYYAGIAGKERKIKTTLGKLFDDADAKKENFLGLIYIGKNLESAQDSGNTGKFISDK